MKVGWTVPAGASHGIAGVAPLGASGPGVGPVPPSLGAEKMLWSLERHQDSLSLWWDQEIMASLGTVAWTHSGRVAPGQVCPGILLLWKLCLPQHWHIGLRSAGQAVLVSLGESGGPRDKLRCHCWVCLPGGHRVQLTYCPWSGGPRLRRH